MRRTQPGPGDVWVVAQSSGAALMLSCVSDGGRDAGAYPQERTLHSCDQPSLQLNVSSDDFERFGGRSIREQDPMRHSQNRSHPMSSACILSVQL